MSSASRLAGPALLAALFALAPLAGKSCCVALTPSSPSSPMASVDGGSNSLDEDRADATTSTNADPDPVANGESTFSDAFFQCYKNPEDSAFSCMGESAKNGISSFFSKAKLELSEGLSLVQEQQRDAEGRETPIDPAAFGFDPSSRTVVDSAAAYLSSRSLRWDMGSFYPGLVMRIGPTLTGAGVLEFVYEPRRYYSDRQLGPSRMVLKQVVLPFLLGLKVSIAALVPLLLFSVVFLAKKALLMSHLSALVSGLLGFGAYGYPGAGHGIDGGAGFGGGVGVGGGLGPVGFGGPVGNSALHGHFLPYRSSVPGPQTNGFPGASPGLDPGPGLGQGQGPQIYHLGAPVPPLGPAPAPAAPHTLHTPWHTPTHLFRGVNYDIRDERHAAGSAAISGAEATGSTTTSTSTSTRNTRGFRWEDKEPPRQPEPQQQHADLARPASTSTQSRRHTNSYSLG